MATREPIRRRPGGAGDGAPPEPPREIPDKLYFRIGEVAALCVVPPYVLRFWESEFPALKPNKGGTGQRLYRRRDVETALRIKALLYDEGYTIPGARQALKGAGRTSREAVGAQLALDGVAPTVETRHLVVLRKELRELHALLGRPVGARAPVHAMRSRAGGAPGVRVRTPPTPFLRPGGVPTTAEATEADDPGAAGLFDALPTAP